MEREPCTDIRGEATGGGHAVGVAGVERIGRGVVQRRPAVGKRGQSGFPPEERRPALRPNKVHLDKRPIRDIPADWDGSDGGWRAPRRGVVRSDWRRGSEPGAGEDNGGAIGLSGRWRGEWQGGIAVDCPRKQLVGESVGSLRCFGRNARKCRNRGGQRRTHRVGYGGPRKRRGDEMGVRKGNGLQRSGGGAAVHVAQRANHVLSQRCQYRWRRVLYHERGTGEYGVERGFAIRFIAGIAEEV